MLVPLTAGHCSFAELASQKVATKVKVPKGTSDYQAAWIAESGEESSEEEEEEQEDEGGPSPTEEDSEEEEEEEGEEDMVSETVPVVDRLLCD